MMKSTWFSAVLLVVPGVATAAMVWLFLSEVGMLGGFVIALVVCPLCMATPVTSALGIAFAVYAIRRGKRWVFPLLLVLIHIVCFAGTAKMWIDDYQDSQARRQAAEADVREHAYVLSLNPDERLIDIVSRRGEYTDILMLLSNGVDPNIRDPEGTPAISLLVQRRDGQKSRILCDLLSAGADPNATDGRGWTALHHACALYKTHCVAELLAHGADHEALTDRGESAMSLVREKGRRVGGFNDEIITILIVEASGASKAELQELEAKLLSNEAAKNLGSLMPSKRFRHLGHRARK